MSPEMVASKKELELKLNK